MKRKLNFWKIILVSFAVLLSLMSLLVASTVIYIIYHIVSWRGPSRDVFERQKEKYTLKVIGKATYDGTPTETTDIFFYETIKNGKNFKIGCGKLLLIGYEPLREYIYGKVEYGTDDIGFGIYQNGDELIYGNGSKEDMTEIEKKYSIELLKKQCTGYFVLDLKTGEYQGGLSEEQQKKILSDKGIENKMKWTREFLDRNGETREDYKGLESWMYILKE
jgi:hypothetical protein